LKYYIKNHRDGEKEQIRLKSFRLYSNGKEVGQNECIVYIKVSGNYKLDIYYNNQVNDYMQPF